MEGLETQYVLNANNVKVKKCCASCKHKQDHEDFRFRKCGRTGDKVVAAVCCCEDGYEISEQMNKLRIGAA